MEDEEAIYSVRRSDEIVPTEGHISAVCTYLALLCPDPKSLLFHIHIKLPHLKDAEYQAMAEILAMLEHKFGSHTDWEHRAKEYLTSEEGTAWMKNQFTRADGVGARDTQPSRPVSTRKRTAIPRTDIDVETIEDVSSPPDGAFQGPQASEPRVAGDTLRILPSTNIIVVAGAALVATFVVWHRLTRFPWRA